jgi:hypothetical protein
MVHKGNKMFSIEALINETAQQKNGKFNGVRIELKNDEIPREILLILDQRKNRKGK